MMYECVVDCKVYECEFEVLSNVQPYELKLSANGSFYHILLGAHQNGNFICIPNWNIGCELAGYSDWFWNSEQLSKQLPFEDAMCIAKGIGFARQNFK